MRWCITRAVSSQKAQQKCRCGCCATVIVLRAISSMCMTQPGAIGNHEGRAEDRASTLPIEMPVVNWILLLIDHVHNRRSAESDFGAC